MIKPPNTESACKLLGNHHEFMESLKTVGVIDDPDGEDSVFWADYHINPKDKTTALKLDVTVFGPKSHIRRENKRRNIKFVNGTADNTNAKKNSLDLLWTRDSFAYAVNPMDMLAHWSSIMKTDAMLCLCVPQTTYIDDVGRWRMKSYSGQYFSWNMITLIQALAVNGFDCRYGHFKQQKNDPYIWACVYKSDQQPFNPRETNWYHLQEAKLTPACLDSSILNRGSVDHRDLVVEWLDHSIYDLSVETRL